LRLTVVGSGYVGLVTAACFAEMGNTVTCVDVDDGKIEGLRQGILPIHEPGLQPIVSNNQKEHRLMFTTSMREAALDSGIFFIAVGTPPGEDGSADLRHVIDAARELGRHITGEYCVIVEKSTVPVGTAEKIGAVVREELQARGAGTEFDVVSNPEFLKEGAAVGDFMRPDRIIIGSESDRARKMLHDLYAPFTRSHERMIFMPTRAAEMTKYASNAMLATKISFMNELAGLCELMGVDVEDVRVGIGSDSRIGYSFIYPGCGYGGSCFPKDLRALISMAEQHGTEPDLLHAVQARNSSQKQVLFQKITRRFGADLSGRAFCLWGLAFKPGTDDIREAPSVVLLEKLLGAGAEVKAYDPAAMKTARRELPAEWFDPGGLRLLEAQMDALEGADAMVLVTEWKSFRHPDFQLMRSLMKEPVIFDGRNLYDPGQLRLMGFEYFGIGR
jgi:UDPglucose 6-dehydrogenase